MIDDRTAAPRPATMRLAFELIVLAEGGSAYSNHPRDPGGPTKWGVSWRAVRLRDADRDGNLDFDLDGDGDVDERDIRQVERHHAEALFAEDYWGPAGCDDLPPSVAIAVADSAYNQGPRTAVALLQRAAGARAGKADGIPGPRTRGAVQDLLAAGRLEDLLTRFGAQRADRYRIHPSASDFFRGWMARLIELDRALISMEAP